MRLVIITVPSPLGDWLAVADEAAPEPAQPEGTYSGAVRMCALVSQERQSSHALARLTAQESAALVAADDGRHPVARALAAYFSGDVRALEAFACLQPGSAFQQSTWQAMRAIQPGGPRSYAALAAATGRATAVRAVASVCAVNRIPLFIPCHRVVRSDGSIGEYYLGSDAKALLLAHERDATG